MKPRDWRIAAAAAVILAACGGNDTPSKDPVVSGAELYQDNCASCHRADLR